jgi:hypothetical protein
MKDRELLKLIRTRLQWRDLTNDEVDEIFFDCEQNPYDYHNFIREIEQKIKEIQQL